MVVTKGTAEAPLPEVRSLQLGWALAVRRVRCLCMVFGSFSMSASSAWLRLTQIVSFEESDMDHGVDPSLLSLADDPVQSTEFLSAIGPIIPAPRTMVSA